jgi:hypothetical protein
MTENAINVYTKCFSWATTEAKYSVPNLHNPNLRNELFKMIYNQASFNLK